MFRKNRLAIILLLFPLLLSGCLFRGDGVFKQIGNSDYKVKMKLLNMFVVADGHPTPVGGIVMLEDRITPLKHANIILKRKSDLSVVSKAFTNHIGYYDMSGILSHDSYLLEIQSPDYTGAKEILVEPGKGNWHEIVATKRKKES